jgi:hypothetical protein
MSGYGSSYGVSWWGDVNAPNGWGEVYPFDAEGSIVTTDSTLYTSDQTNITADNGVSSGTVAFTCTNSIFSLSNGTTGSTITLNSDATVTLGTLQSVSPSTYQSGSNTYTASILSPSGYSNTGTNISCTDTATGSASGLPTSPGTLNTTRWAIMSSYNSTNITYVYNSVTYLGGFTDTLTDITNFNGTNVTGIGSNFVQFDGVTPIVGSYVADGYGTFLSSTSMGFTGGQYAAFATPKYMRVAATTVGSFGDPFVAFPTYKVEQANGYVQITQIITT